MSVLQYYSMTSIFFYINIILHEYLVLRTYSALQIIARRTLRMGKTSDYKDYKTTIPTRPADLWERKWPALRSRAVCRAEASNQRTVVSLRLTSTPGDPWGNTNKRFFYRYNGQEYLVISICEQLWVFFVNLLLIVCVRTLQSIYFRDSRRICCGLRLSVS